VIVCHITGGPWIFVLFATTDVKHAQPKGQHANHVILILIDHSKLVPIHAVVKQVIMMMVLYTAKVIQSLIIL
jgi:hypothetical protein